MRRSFAPALLAAGGILAGAGLRVYQLTRCMTGDGLVRSGSPILAVMLGFAALVLGAAAFLCTRQIKTLGSERCLTGPAVYLFLDLAGAILIFFGSLMRLLDGGSLWLFVGGMAAAGCLCAAALLYGRRSPVTFWLLLLPCGFLAAQLIVDFKGWSTDPLVIDFCFRLLAQVCTLLAVFHVSGFALSVGRRRMTVFWCIGAAVFTAMSTPDFFLGRGVSLGQLMLQCGGALWCASHALRILFAPPDPPREEPKPEAAEAPKPEAEPANE